MRIRKEVESLVANGNTKEALEIMSVFVLDKNKNLYNNITVYKSEYNQLKKDYSIGGIERSEYRKHIRKINHYILDDLVEQIEKIERSIEEANKHKKPPLKVAIAIVRYNKRFLLTERKNKEGKLSWGFPAGMVKPSLLEKEVVAKECFEETNIKIKPLFKLGQREHPDTHIIVSYWICDYISGEAENKDKEELATVKWLSSNEALNIITSNIYPPLKEYLMNSKIPEKIIVSVAVVCDGDKVLLAKRRKKEGDLQWQFPAGKIEEGEDSNAAAEREVFEETGVKCKAMENLGRRIHPNTEVEIHYWACEYLDGDAFTKDADELESVFWCEKSDIKNYITSDIFPAIQKHLSK